jgi:hypothetical protein
MAAQEGAAEEQKWQAGLQVQSQEDEVKAHQARVADINRRYDEAADEARRGTVDENRYMRGSAGVLSAIGMAMGAFGAVLGRSPNFAQQFVEQQIEKDIRKQELDLRNKRDSANALGQLRDKFGGDLQLAQGVLRQLMTERVAAQNRLAALTAKSDQMRNYYAEVAALGEAKALRDREALGIAFNEKVMTSPLYYQQGRAGTSGGYAPLTQDAYEKAGEGRRDWKKLEQDAQNGSGKQPTPLSSDRTEKLSSYANALQAAHKVKSELAARGVVGDRLDDPTAGVIDRAANVESNEEIKQSTVALAKGLQSAFGKTDRDAADAEAMATGGGSGRDRYKAAERAEDKLVGNLRTELSTLPPQQQQQILSTLPEDVVKKVLATE